MEAGRDVVALLADVAAVGPFFAVATGPPPPGGPWTPLRAAGALAERADAVRNALGTDGRVAASTAFQELAAQVVAPLLAAVAVHGVLPVPAAGRAGIADVLHRRPGGPGPWLWWRGGGRVEAADAAALRGVVAALLAPPVAAVARHAGLPALVLWGNAASAVASARRLLAAAVPGAAAGATAAAAHLLTTAPLAPTAALRDPEPPDVGWTFRRRTCCLYHRVPGGGLCGDCVLLDRAPRHPLGRRRRRGTAGRARPRLT